MQKFNLQHIKSDYSHLVELRQQIDPQSTIYPIPFQELREDITELSKSKTAAEEDISNVQLQLSALREYLHQFDAFQRLQNNFFKEIESYEDDFLAKSQHYLAVQHYTQEIRDDFTNGRYIIGGIYPSIQQLERHIKAFKQQIVAQQAEEEREQQQKEWANKIAETFRVSESSNVIEYVKNNFSPTPDFSPERIAQIKKGYHRHQKEVLMDMVIGRKNKLAQPLDRLKKALLSGHTKAINLALQNFKKVIAPVAISSHKNYKRVQLKLQDIEGTAEPLTTLHMAVNDDPPLHIKVEKSGKFNVKDVPLVFGENTIQLYNEDFLFLDNRRYVLHIHLEEKYPFIGLYDPLTQKAFEREEVSMIVRCTTCRNYMYDFSVEDNDDVCASPRCDGKKFNRHKDTAFWAE